MNSVSSKIPVAFFFCVPQKCWKAPSENEAGQHKTQITNKTKTSTRITDVQEVQF